MMRTAESFAAEPLPVRYARFRRLGVSAASFAPSSACGGFVVSVKLVKKESSRACCASACAISSLP
jgi:hypothetical protein